MIVDFVHDTGGQFSEGSFWNKPCPAILTQNHHHWVLTSPKQRINTKMQQNKNKPPYKLPTMQEIEAIKWNGFNVVSTFSGTGGSCLGYRMDGFRVLWANEFVPIAQESYKANHPNSILDKRDIRNVKPDEILNAIGLKKGELDLFDGSPPCQAFSTAGKREKNWGKGKKYEHGAVQNNEDLFFEYVRILDGLQPKVFIAENVSGLVKGTAKGYFKIILQQLKNCGYNVKAKVLDAQWLGVPQMRQRVIFIGVRNDLNINPVYPKPLSYRYSVNDALPNILTIGEPCGFGKSKQIKSDVPYHTVGTAPQHDNGLARFVESEKGIKRKFTIAELKRICAFPDDFELKGTYAQQWERLGNSVPPVMMYHIAKTIAKLIN